MSTSDLKVSPSQFPAQKKSQSQKTPSWFKQCIDSAAGLSAHGGQFEGTNKIRSTRKNKIINYNLVNGIVDQDEMSRAVDPFKIQFQDMPINYKNYPLINPNLNLLIGEERNRSFNPIFMMNDSEATTQKVRDLQERFEEFAIEKVISGITDEKKLQKEVEQFAKWSKYSYKDTREKMANQVIQYLTNKLNLNEKFSRGFEDLTIAAEEIYVIDIIGNEPVVRKGDPANFFTLRGGNSYKIEDNEVIVEDGFLPPGEVVDRYYEDLKPEQIRQLEEGYSYHTKARKSLFRNQLENDPIDFSDLVEQEGIGTFLESNQKGASIFGGWYDKEGNVRVTRVVWRGFVKVGILEYFDENDQFQRDIVPEHYEPDSERGEKVEWQWITEWYEGTRVGKDIYLRCQPREVQMRRMDNISASHPGIVGTSFNVDGYQARSLVDLCKEYQYLYNVIMYRTEIGIAKYLGKVGKINSAMIPKGWDMSKFLSYLYNMNLMIEDPFNEGNKGAAMGKLSGQSTPQGSTTAEIGDAEFITRHLEILSFIENRISEITGITPQRKGAIDNRETAQGVERSVTQSSHITEKWFSVHDDTKIRVLECMLETAKTAWDEKSFVRSFVLNDGTEAMLDFDSEVFNETDYSGYLSSDRQDTNILERMKATSETLIQSGAPMSMVTELMKAKDVVTLQNKIEEIEDEMAEKQQQAQEMEAQQEQEKQELEMMKLDMEQQDKELDREIEQYKIDQDNRTRLAVAQIQAYRFQDDWDKKDTGQPDPSEIARTAIDEKKLRTEAYNKQQERSLKEKEQKEKADLERRKLKLDEKKSEIDKMIEEKKLKLQEKQIQADKENTKAVEKAKRMKYKE